ncbi:MAG: hypothetical protein HOI53_05730 [Francisellaceae bacterium]|jgi:hypothetical protein|nr:hypothetical protein [Francisellaceae bacterium]MBT6207508.1 hypothetical protein [Francisellaceae bacterium]MBT6538452.1 hypothetical protein [Francisellaceae bacterium]
MANFFNIFKNRWGSKVTSPFDIDTYQDVEEKATCWWGCFSLEESQSKFWRVGEAIIYIDRFTHEWHIGSTLTTQESVLPLDNTTPPSPPKNMQSKTFTFTTQAEVRLKPVLPKLSLASKLQTPLYIPGGEQILLYISSPVWVQITTSNNRVILDEIPTHPLSLTWFGENTIDGELCFAGNTFCSSQLKYVPAGADRIISPMLIKNQSKKILCLEKINVPLPHLSVYSDKQNYLWTEQLTVYNEGDDPPLVQISKGPPKSMRDITLISRGRMEFRSGTNLKRLVYSLIGT